MSPLRQQMHDAMLVRGLALRTRETYIEAVAKLARFYHAGAKLLRQSISQALSRKSFVSTRASGWPGKGFYGIDRGGRNFFTVSGRQPSSDNRLIVPALGELLAA